MNKSKILFFQFKIVPAIVLFAIMAGCAHYAGFRMSDLYGQAEPQQRTVALGSEHGQFYHQQVQPLIEKRCVVCHGCYDAPCQLKLSSVEGIDRGASKQLVYDGARLLKSKPSRLFIDHNNVKAWRDDGFYPVLNERDQTAEVNLQAGVMSRLLTLKQEHPLPVDKILPDSFDFSLSRKQQCPELYEMKDYERKFPAWGMPYGLPGLSQVEHQTLQKWLKGGAKMAPQVKLTTAHTQQIEKWERFLNGDSLKQQLMARYLYEHWFLAHLYFTDLPAGEFFRIVRSTTPSNEPIDIIATHRPFDDPGVGRVYYRLWRERGSILAKTHMPYALNDARLKKITQLFLEADYNVTRWPSYKAKVAANPFKSFEEIPEMIRYKFLLEEAQFTIMNFIKGPVCRGQVALNVINDHFWVFFVKPWEKNNKGVSTFFDEQQNNLVLPTAAGSDALILTNWLKYSKRHRKFLRAKAERMNTLFPNGEHLTTEGVWDGGGENPNAALTVFRHFDSATVIKGLVGQRPKTAWIIDYSLLERIHYLLVAGFDVYGNVGHQLNTRLFMDFLRIEGEFNFLALLPPKARIEELQDWYQGVSKRQLDYLYTPYKLFQQPSGETYQTDQPKQELYQKLQKHLGAVLKDSYNLERESVPALQRVALQKLAKVKGAPASLLAQVTILTVMQDDGGQHHYTMLHNDAHSNITSLLDETKHRLPEQDTITIVDGFIGDYPEAFMRVDESQLNYFIETLLTVRTAEDYQKLLDRFGVRRTNSAFWKHSDRVQTSYKTAYPYTAGLLDYGRLENR